MTNGAFSILSYVDTSKLTDAERAELERLQAEINETVARIQSTNAAYVPKTTAWTDEERAEMAKRREADNADAYELGLDGKPIKVRIVPPDAEHPMARVFRLEDEIAMQRGKQ